MKEKELLSEQLAAKPITNHPLIKRNEISFIEGAAITFHQFLHFINQIKNKINFIFI